MSKFETGDLLTNGERYFYVLNNYAEHYALSVPMYTRTSWTYPRLDVEENCYLATDIFKEVD